MYQGTDTNQMKSGPSKPPRPLNTTQPQAQLYSNYNQYQQQQQPPQPPPEFVIIHIIPNADNTTLNEFGCIVLSPQLYEKESYSFNFAHHNNNIESISSIYTLLNNRSWIINNAYVQQMIDNLFKKSDKVPQFISIINTQDILNNSGKVNVNARNARIGCNDIYQTLQRIALANLLQQLNPLTRPIQSNIDQNDFIPNDLNNNQWDNNNNNDNDNSNMKPINNYDIETYNDNLHNNDQTQTQIQQTQVQQIDEQVVLDNNNKNDQQYDVDDGSNQYQQPNGYHGDNQAQNIINDANTSSNVDPQDVNQQVDDDNVNKDDNNNNNNVDDDIIQSVEPKEESQTQSIASSSNPVIIAKSITPKDDNVDKDINKDVQVQTQPVSTQPQTQPIMNTTATTTTTTTATTSWAHRLKSNKSSTSSTSPKKPQMTVKHIITGRGPYGSSTRSPEGIRQFIDDAIKKNKRIWVSYDGHQRPFIPREILPKAWSQPRSNSNRKESFYAIQHKSKSGNQQKFILKYVVQVSDKHWKLSKHELQKMKRNNQRTYNNYNQYNNSSYNNNNNNNNNNNQQNNNNYDNNNRNYNSMRQKRRNKTNITHDSNKQDNQ